MELWQNLRRLRKQSGMTLEEVAKQLPGNVSRVAVGFWESTNPESRTEPRKKNREALANLYGVTVAELMDRGGQYESIIDSKNESFSSKTPLIGLIPLIELVHYGDSNVADISLMDSGIAVSMPVSEGTVAIKVEGNSMFQEGAVASYPNGSIIVCDPSLIHDVKVGDGVIAVLSETGRRVFKEYDKLDGAPILKAVNRQYPSVTGEFELLAVVTQTINLRR